MTGGSDNIVTEYNTYEDFLDSQINDVDLFYLEVSIDSIVVTNRRLELLYSPSLSEL